mmetsp:Transcript_10719/g.13306  ORF Transcript_10719/g.13306 Transcript_10719/m.13306 type:complete len:376 (+) Transcript_10719:65-1192(+)
MLLYRSRRVNSKQLTTLVNVLRRQFLSSKSAAQGVDLEETISLLSRRHQTGVSLRGLIDAGTRHVSQLEAQKGVLPTPILLTVASFLHRELPIRLSRRVCELDGLPRLHDMPSVKVVREWYARSISEIVQSERPVDATTEAAFALTLEKIYERHAAVLLTMARGAHELRTKMSARETFISDHKIHGFLDSFYTSRIGIRMIIGQYLALRRCEPHRRECVGLLNTAVIPRDIATDAARHAASLCERQFGLAPEVQVRGRLDLSFAYVPDHLYYIMLELLKNSMRATVENAMLRTNKTNAFHLDHSDLPPIRVVVADGEDNEDVALKVSDEGGGIPRSHLPRVWSYLFTTASFDAQKRLVEDTGDNSDFAAPLAGLG